MSSRWLWISARTTSRCGVSASTCSSRHSLSRGRRRRAGRASGPAHGLFDLLRGNRQVVGRRQLFQRHRMKVIILVQSAQPSRVVDMRDHMTHEPFDVRRESRKASWSFR